MIVEGGRYQVKLVPSQCHREETILDIISALDHLEAITNQIFSSIKDRLEAQRAHVANLSARASVASQQVAAFKSSGKGIRIVSPAKYPESTENEDEGKDSKRLFNSAFQALVSKPVPPQSSYVADLEGQARDRCLMLTSPIKNPTDLLQVFHVRDVNVVSANVEKLENTYERGLGEPSPEFNMIDSFLLFNTVENPYQNYRVVEKDLKRTLSTKVSKKVDVTPIEVASPTVKVEEKQQDFGDFFYNPSSMEIPDIGVPDILPDLAGVVDLSLDLPTDIFPSGSPFQKISPSPAFGSSANTSSIVSPTAQSVSSLDSEYNAYGKPQETETTVVPKPANVSTSVSGGAPPPPPPPPLPSFPLFDAPTGAAAKVAAPSPFVPTGSVPPPPPPPPPPSLAISVDDVDSGKKEAKSGATRKPNIPSGVDDRSNLMAAIRGAGGAGILKSVKDRKYEAKIKKQEEKEKKDAGETTDMMADLKNTLAMRRRGISGLGDNRKAGLGDIMGKLAASIPTLEDSNEDFGGMVSDEEDWDS